MASIFSPGFRKGRHRVGKFSTRLPLSVRSLFCLFQTYTNGICCVCKSRTAPGRPQTGRVKLKILPGAVTGEAKFSLGEGKKIHWVSYRGVYECCRHSLTDGRYLSTTLQQNRLGIECSSNRPFLILVVGGRYESCCQRL